MTVRLLNADRRVGRKICMARRDRLDLYTVKTDDGCWLWSGPTQKVGYGRFADGAGRSLYAHRVAFEEWVGPIPESMTVDHICGEKLCVRPDHLRLLTREEHGRIDQARRITRSTVGLRHAGRAS